MRRRFVKPDVIVECHGSVFLFNLLSDAARAWVEEHVDDAVYLGETLAVEHRCAAEVARGMQDGGLVVR